MQLPIFVEHRLCKNRQLCSKCRSKTPEGEQLRKSIAERFTVPAGGVDFACPAGIPWEYPDRGLGDTVYKLLDKTGVGKVAKAVIETATGKPCGCGGRRDALNKLLPNAPTPPPTPPASAGSS